MFSEEEKLLMDRLAAIHQRVNQLADNEARSTLVKGWAARGGHLAEKKQLLEKAEKILAELMAQDNA